MKSRESSFLSLTSEMKSRESSFLSVSDNNLIINASFSKVPNVAKKIEAFKKDVESKKKPPD